MRNLFLFLGRYKYFLTFLFFQGVALWFLFRFNRFHRVRFMGVANEITGRINSQYNQLEDFFSLQKENERLHRFNDSLLNYLPYNFVKADTSVKIFRDSLRYDTVFFSRRYLSRPAAVIYNTTSSSKNYMQINKGALHGIKDNMAVISSDGFVAGLVVNVSPRFSQVMSLIHVQSRVSASIKRTGHFGTVLWDGKDPMRLTLKDIPKDAKVQRGDTVVTSPYSFHYPPGFVIGYVSEIIKDRGSNFYILKIKPAADFFNIQNVHVIENLDRTEQVQLDKETRNKTEKEN
ncbi:MAG: rod shape-determining protein MreC [Chitinophagaceae bacterium]|nr:rod shape-determining protein MreC [Chitinophagaceae bacterium]